MAVKVQSCATDATCGCGGTWEANAVQHWETAPLGLCWTEGGELGWMGEGGLLGGEGLGHAHGGDGVH